MKAICEICGKTYDGSQCMRCTQTARALTFQGEELGATGILPQSGSSVALLAGSARLKATDGNRELPVAKPFCRIGWDPRNDVVVKDPLISQFHAQIRFEGEDYFVSDLGSAEGTWLNGEKIDKEEQLFPGYHLKVGNSKFYFIPEE
jgi:pSer/pThr/pTyr-binding forkhead associated (FHA) protein